MELKFLNADEKCFWAEILQVLLSKGYGVDVASSYADQLTLEYRKRNY